MKLKGGQQAEKIFIPKMIKYSTTYVHEKVIQIKKENQDANRSVT